MSSVLSAFLKLISGHNLSEEQDTSTGLSPKDINNIQKSWSLVHCKAIEFGMNIFKRLFTEHPEAQELFKPLASLSLEELNSAPKMKAHSLNFVSFLNMVITQLDDKDVATAILEKLALTHRSKNVIPEHFDITKSIIINILSEQRSIDSATLKSWHRLFDFMDSIIKPILVNK